MEDIVALLFGAVIIMFFSYERFNRVTYDGGQQLKRLISILSPDKLRARRIVVNAYLFYALTLEVIYFFLCIYAKLLPALGGPNLMSTEVGASKLPSGASETATSLVEGFDQATELWVRALSTSDAALVANPSFDIGIPPTVSLATALIIVGLAPSFPVLQRFEDWLRGAAHRLAGIPTHIISVAEDLRRNDSGILGDGPTKEGRLLVPEGNWERMKHYQNAAKDQLTAPDDFKRDLKLIFALSAWILDRRLKTRNSKERQRFDRLEEELRRRTSELVLQLDEKSGYRLGNSAEKPEEDSDETDERKRASWERLAETADDLADDLYILLALFVEHEVLVFGGSPQDNSRQQELKKPASPRQQELALEKMEEVLGDHATPGQVRSYTMVSLWWTAGVTLLISLLWSLVPGAYEYELQFGSQRNVYWRVLDYTFDGSISLFMPVLVALAMRDGGLQSRNWCDIKAHWTVRLPQMALVFVVSWAVASLFRIGIVLWQSVLAGGANIHGSLLWPSVRTTFEYNAPAMVRGAVLGLLVIGLLDERVARRARPDATRGRTSSLWLAARAAAIMAFWAGVTRALTAWSAAVNALPPRSGLDDIDRGLIVYSMLFSAIVGFFVVHCVAEAVFAQRRVSGDKAKSGISDQGDQVATAGSAPAAPTSGIPAAGE
ncbi:hypothetical protein ACCT28_36255 [Rhizobium ruizarguesonis]